MPDGDDAIVHYAPGAYPLCGTESMTAVYTDDPALVAGCADCLELAAERKVYVRPTSAGIAAEAMPVLPGSTRAVRTTEPLAAPAHQVHIHVAGPEGLTDLQEAPH